MKWSVCTLTLASCCQTPVMKPSQCTGMSWGLDYACETIYKLTSNSCRIKLIMVIVLNVHTCKRMSFVSEIPNVCFKIFTLSQILADCYFSLKWMTLSWPIYTILICCSSDLWEGGMRAYFSIVFSELVMAYHCLVFICWLCIFTAYCIWLISTQIFRINKVKRGFPSGVNMFFQQSIQLILYGPWLKVLYDKIYVVPSV